MIQDCVNELLFLSRLKLVADISKANFVRLFDFEHDAVKPKLIHYIVHFRLCLGMLFDGDARMFSIGLFADKL